MSGQMPIHPADEQRLAAEIARELETATAQPGVTPSDGFADRIMAAVADEPLPQPVRAFGLALAGGRFRAAFASLGDAWRVVSGGGTPGFVRAQALALVLVVLIGSVALAGGATVGALNLLSGQPPVQPSPTVQLPSPSVEPSPTPSPSIEPAPTADVSPEPTQSVEPTETPEPTKAPTATPRQRTPQPTATGTDDHGGGGGGGGGDGETLTPSPTGTNDHGGGSGDG